MVDEELKELVRENNAILKKIRGAQKRGRIFTFLYWLVVVAVALGFFYYLQPFLTKLTNLLQDFVGTATGIGGSISDVNLLNGFFEQLGNKN